MRVCLCMGIVGGRPWGKFMSVGCAWVGCLDWGLGLGFWLGLGSPTQLGQALRGACLRGDPKPSLTARGGSECGLGSWVIRACLINCTVHLPSTLTLVGVAWGASVCLRDWGSVRHGASTGRCQGNRTVGFVFPWLIGSTASGCVSTRNS